MQEGGIWGPKGLLFGHLDPLGNFNLLIIWIRFLGLLLGSGLRRLPAWELKVNRLGY